MIMELSTRELRIGNRIHMHVGTSGNKRTYQEVVVTGINPERIQVNMLDLWHPIGRFKAIPIMEDRLLELGFERANAVSVMFSKTDNARMHTVRIVKEINGLNAWNVFDAHMRRFSYLHKLQNIWFQVTGEELEFKKEMK